MGILQIHKAKRSGARLVFGFAGWTGCGKTVSAIKFGYGLAGYDASKLGFMDAENKRGSLNADILLKDEFHPTKTEFMIGDLIAPFSPQRYIEGILEFEAAGAEVLIIDSVSHEHEGIGGLIDIADGGPEHPTPGKYWNRSKGEHKKFMNVLLQSSMHIICCVRAREKSEPTVVDGKKGYADLGLTPIIEKNFMFEMTASLMLHDQGKRHDNIKVPGALEGSLGQTGRYLTCKDGAAVREWVEGAEPVDPTVEKFRGRLLVVTEKGEKFVREEAWDKTPDDIKKALGGDAFYESLIASAKAHDKARAEADAGASDDSAPTDGGGVAADLKAKAAAAPKATPKAEPAKPAPAPEPEKREPEKREPAKTKSTVVVEKTAEAPAKAPEQPPAEDKRPAATPKRTMATADPPF